MPNGAPTFGDLLRGHRLRAGLSQSELAEKANISEAAVGLLERGLRKAPHRQTIVLLAKALGLESDERETLEAARGEARRNAASPFQLRNNLRPERTPLVAREADLVHLRMLLGRSRLVSTIGAGGVGKTRVAVETARALVAAFPEIWFVDFASLVDGEFIPSKIAGAIQPPLGDRAGTVPGLTGALSDRHMLLIFDNCEHVIEHAARVADAILDGCARVSILATSRERLGVDGEVVYRLPSLSIECAAHLFMQRARAADPNLVVDDRNLGTITEIARSLDGIPLALELTAAHVPSLGLDILRARLHERLGLPSGRRDLPPRQQTVRATIEWSYNLLDDGEQGLLLEVGIFTGGFTIEALEVVHADGPTGRRELLSLLASLVNKSLVNSENTSTGVRYSSLESVRAFAHERLRGNNAYDAVARRHATWLAEVGDRIAGEVTAPDLLVALLADVDNARAAIVWSLNAQEQDDRALAGRILVGLTSIWDAMGRDWEHLQWTETALTRIDDEKQPLVVVQLLCRLMYRKWTSRSALEYLDRALRLCETSVDDLRLVELCNAVANVQAMNGDFAGSDATLFRSRELLMRNRQQSSRGYCNYLHSRYLLCLLRGSYDEARAALDEAEAMALALEMRDYVVQIIHTSRIDLEYAAGNKQLALETAERLLGGEYGTHPVVINYTLPRLIILRLLLGKAQETVAALREFMYFTSSGARTGTVAELEYAALGFALLGNVTLAARLFGLVSSVEKRDPFRRSPLRQDVHDALESTLRRDLAEDDLTAAVASGALMTYEDAIDQSLAALDAFIKAT